MLKLKVMIGSSDRENRVEMIESPSYPETPVIRCEVSTEWDTGRRGVYGGGVMALP